MAKNDFTHIPGLTNEKPKTKTGLVRYLWPEIRQALNSGYTIKEICLALNGDGFSIRYSRLRFLVARLRRLDIAETERMVIISEDTQTKSGPVVSDAGAALRAQRAKKIKFDHNPFSTRIKDLV